MQHAVCRTLFISVPLKFCITAPIQVISNPCCCRKLTLELCNHQAVSWAKPAGLAKITRLSGEPGMVRFASLFTQRPKPLFGVDISAARVKLLELEQAGDALRVLSYASEPLPTGAVTAHQIIDAEAVAQSISRALERSGSSTRDAAIAVSGPAVISKLIDMPAVMSDAELEEHIHFDAAHYIPHPIEEVNLDFQVLGPHPVREDLNRVLLVACRRDNIEMRIAALEMARMKVRLVDVEEYALQSACRLLAAHGAAGRSDGATIAVFDVGAHETRLTVQRHGQSVYTREIAFGGQALADQLVAQHDLPHIEQLHAMLRTGDLDASVVADELGDFAERLATQIERSLQFYVSASAADNDAIDEIIVVGGPTCYPGLQASLATQTSRPLTLGNPLAGLMASGAARRNRVDIDAPSLMVATGLALRGTA